MGGQLDIFTDHRAAIASPPGDNVDDVSSAEPDAPPKRTQLTELPGETFEDIFTPPEAA